MTLEKTRKEISGKFLELTEAQHKWDVQAEEL
jgi:hypothetical protein